VLVFVVISFLVTLIFHASVDAREVPTQPVFWC
jgi:hypothetical protein